MASRRKVTLHLQPPTWGMPTCHPDFLQVLAVCARCCCCCWWCSHRRLRRTTVARRRRRSVARMLARSPPPVPARCSLSADAQVLTYCKVADVNHSVAQVLRPSLNLHARTLACTCVCVCVCVRARASPCSANPACTGVCVKRVCVGVDRHEQDATFGGSAMADGKSNVPVMVIDNT